MLYVVISLSFCVARFGNLNKQNVLKTVVITFITLSIFYIIFTKIDFHSVVAVLLRANVFYLFIAIVLSLMVILLGVKRWQIILDTMNHPVPFSKCFTVVMGALPLTSITPSKSGDVIKAYYLRKEIPISKTIGSVLTERVFDIFALVLFSLIGMIFCQRFELAGIALAALFGIAAIFFIPHVHSDVPASGSWMNKIYNIMLSMKTLTKDKKAFSSAMLCSLLSWFLSIIQTLIFFYAIGVKIPLLFVVANIPIAIFIGMIPITLGGMGTRDAAIIFLFSEYATPCELLSVGILFSVVRYWMLSLIGIPFMRKLLRQN